MGLNKAMLIGNVGREPEVRDAGSTRVANFSLATTDRRYKDKDGKPRTEWHNVTAWGKLAEIIEQYVHKGDSLYIEGRIQTRKWQGKDGGDRYTTEIVADQMDMLSSRGSSSPAPSAPAQVDDPGF